MEDKKLYTSDKSLSDQLTLNHFYNDFDSHSFIDGLSSNIVEEARIDLSEFVARPFIHSFEYALDSLLNLKSKVHQRIGELEVASQQAELAQKQNIKNLEYGFQQVQDTSNQLEHGLNKVGPEAVRIGEQLETIHKQRSRAAQTRDLFKYFNEFGSGQCAQLEEMRLNRGPEGQYQAAIITRRLTSIAKELDVPNASTIQQNIEKYSEKLETDLLETFDQAYSNGDIATMARCSKTLLDFNGGNSCVQTYVNQHEFFYSKRKMRESTYNMDMSINTDFTSISDPMSSPSDPDPYMVKLCDEIRSVVAKEWEVISQVFPNSLNVLQLFVERMFAQSIQTYLESLLDQTRSLSLLNYLRTLASAHSCVSSLVHDLKKFDQETIFPTIRRQMINQTTSVVANQVHDTHTSVSITLDQCMEDLFVPYLDNSMYLNMEKDFLESTLSGIIDDFLNPLQKATKKTTTKQNLFTRVTEKLNTNLITTNLLNTGNTTPDSAPASPTVASTPGTPNNRRSYYGNRQSLEADEDFNSSKSPQLQMVSKLLIVHGEALGRCAELCPPSDLARSAIELFQLLTKHLSEHFLVSVYDSYVRELTLRDLRVEPEFNKTFEIVAYSTHIVQLVQKHFQNAILPLMIHSPPAYRMIVIYKNEFISTIEGRINFLLQSELSSFSSWIPIILQHQKPTDFKPNDHDFDLMTPATDPCLRSVDVLIKMCGSAQQYLEGENLRTFLIELGVILHEILLDHYKRYTVSINGGLLLSNDISKFQTVINELKIPQLTERFEMLRALSNLFIQVPEALPAVLRDGILGKIDPQLLYPYLTCREDYRSSNIAKIVGFRHNAAGAMINTEFR